MEKETESTQAVAEAAESPPSGEAIGTTMLPVSQLQDWKHGNGRHDYDKVTLEELAASVRTRGILQPLIVRRLDGQGKHGAPFEIVAGHRRKRAADLAGLKEVPCIVKVLSDEEAKQEQLIENLQRENPHPLDEALGYREFLAKYQTDVETLAAKVGKPVVYIVKRQKLADLIPEAQKVFREKRFGVEYGLLLARLQPGQQKEALKATGPNRGELGSPSHLRNWIERHILLNLSSAPWKLDDAELVPKAGACLGCTKRTGCNKLLFDDVGKEDLCTDPACFNEKQSAHLKRKEAELKAKGEEPVKISTEWYGAPKGALSRDKWREATKKDKPDAVKTAIMQDGPGIGQVKKIVEGREDGMGRSPLSPSEKAARKRQIEQNRIGKETERRQLQAILEKVVDPIEGESLRRIVAKLWQRTVHESRKHVCAFMGWEAAKNKGFGGRDWEAPGAQAIQEADALGLRKLAALLSIYGYAGPDAGELKTWGAACKVDLGKIAKSVKTEFDAKKQAKPNAEKGAASLPKSKQPGKVKKAKPAAPNAKHESKTKQRKPQAR